MLNLGLKIVSCQLEVYVNGQDTGLHTIYFSPGGLLVPPIPADQAVQAVQAVPNVAEKINEEIKKSSSFGPLMPSAQNKMAQMAPMVLDLYKKGKSNGEIARELGLSYQQVWRACRNGAKRLKSMITLPLNRVAEVHIIKGTERKSLAALVGGQNVGVR